VTIRLDGEGVVVHANGWVDAPGRATRVGVLDYGTHREFRPVSEVMAPASLASLRGVPLTIEHPNGGVVTTANTKAVTDGVVMDVWPDGEFVGVRVRLYTDAGIAAAREYRELSCGYEADVMDEGGVYEGQTYEKTQRNIRYNHLSIVPEGRAGPEARLLLDHKGPDMITITKEQAASIAWIMPSIRAAAKKRRTDEAGIAVKIGEDEFVLPRGMVDQIKAMLGIGAPEAPEAAPVEAEAEAMGEEMEGDEGEAMGDPMAMEAPVADEYGAAVQGGAPNGATYDAATVKKAVADALAAERQRVAVVDRCARFAKVSRDASVIDALETACKATGMDPARASTLRLRGDAVAVATLEGWLDAKASGSPAALPIRRDDGVAPVVTDPIAAVGAARSAAAIERRARK